MRRAACCVHRQIDRPGFRRRWPRRSGTNKETDDWNERMIPEKPAPDAILGGRWFSERIMRNQQKDDPR
jgi:hypothetical protein